MELKTKTNSNSLWIFSVLFYCLLHFTCGNLDFEELQGTNYEIDILDTPVEISEVNSQPTVRLSSRFGQQYQCTYQPVDDSNRKLEEQVALETGIVELLRPMIDQPCLVQLKGWWTYEFCYGKYVKQYRVEDGKVAGNVLFLGYYESDYDWNSETEQNHNKKLNRYHSQKYVNGTECDLTGKPRQVEVRFMCTDGLTEQITRIDEPSTCEYTMVIQTTKICHHPYLRQVKATKPIPITCHPLLNSEDYQLYQSELTAKKEAERLQLQQKVGDLLVETPAGEETTAKAPLKNSLSDLEELYKEALKDGLSETDSKLVNDLKSTIIKTVHPMGAEEPLTDAAEDSVESDDKETDKDMKEILKDFTKELEDITPSKDARKRLSKYKDTISSAMQSQFSKIIEEAEGEVGEQLDDRGAAIKHLSTTLDQLINKLQKTEDELKVVEDEIAKKTSDIDSEKVAGDEIAPKTPWFPDAEVDEDGNIINPSEDTQDDEETDDGLDADDPSLSAPSDDDGEDNAPSVKVSVSQLRKLPFSTKKKALGDGDEEDDDEEDEDSGMEEDIVVESETRRKLEKKMSSELQKAGLDLGGHQIQVKIIAGFNNDDSNVYTLSDDEASAFSDMIVKMIGGSSAASRETEKHNKLEQNYGFVFKSNKNTDNENSYTIQIPDTAIHEETNEHLEQLTESTNQDSTIEQKDEL